MAKTISWKRILILVVIIIGALAIWNIQFSLDLSRKKSISERIVEELMYFPSGKFLKPAVIEYQTAMSDIVWLRSIQYYAQHLMSDRKFEWLDHIFDILTSLDPKFTGAYDFGSIILAWDARQVNQALQLLYRGMEHNPLDWQIVFNAAFIEYMLRRDYVSAGYYFETASKLPGTWTITERWAAFAFAKGGAKNLAIEVWAKIYGSTQNRKLKELAERELIKLGVKL
jgi:hypothetical protein